MANFNLNKVILGGRLTTAPELKQTTSGTLVTSFSLAVDRKFQKDSQNKQTDFIQIVAWRQTAEFISNYFKKGSSICIIGEIQTRSYDKDGVKRYITEVIATEAYFVDSKAEAPNDALTGGYIPQSYITPAGVQSAAQQCAAVQSAPQFEVIYDDELPF
jgi:single-strand DNA-binding protein